MLLHRSSFIILWFVFSVTVLLSPLLRPLVSSTVVVVAVAAAAAAFGDIIIRPTVFLPTKLLFHPTSRQNSSTTTRRIILTRRSSNMGLSHSSSSPPSSRSSSEVTQSSKASSMTTTTMMMEGAAASSSSSSSSLSSGEIFKSNHDDNNSRTSILLPSSSSSTTTYNTPKISSTSVQPIMAHYIFLVHGWLGNDLEMNYLSSALKEVVVATTSSSHHFLPSPLELQNPDAQFWDTTTTTTTDCEEENSSMKEEDDKDGGKRIRTSNSYESRLLANQYEDEAENNNNNNNNNDTTTIHQITSNNIIMPEIIIHSVKCNVGRTHDGIRNGGTRLANEILDFIQSDVQRRYSMMTTTTTTITNDESNQATLQHHNISYSIVGNSLGGLYARYALSLLPYQIQIPLPTQQQPTITTTTTTTTTTTETINKRENTTKIMSLLVVNLNPNVFCTTATPHLGVSQHTYWPIPRIAEKLIGTGMGMTGRDLFRLNSSSDDKESSSFGLAAAVTSGRSKIYGGLMEESAPEPPSDERVNSSYSNSDNSGGEQSKRYENRNDEETDCIIRTMCLQDKYLLPLGNFRRRIAYANVYGTDFQVPTATAAFLNEQSEVKHCLIASRMRSNVYASGVATRKQYIASSHDESATDKEDTVLPSFIVAIVQTEKQSHIPTLNGGKLSTSSDELLRMSQCLDALGWTKVFIDVRDRIPIPSLSKPSWLRSRCDSLDDLIRKHNINASSLLASKKNVEESASSTSLKRKAGGEKDESAEELPPTSSVDTTTWNCILTSRDLAQSTNVGGDSIHFPMGHTVMIANAKNEKYTQWNRLGRPVMDRLAKEMMNHILEFK